MTIVNRRSLETTMPLDRFAEYAFRYVLTALFVVAVYLLYVNG